MFYFLVFNYMLCIFIDYVFLGEKLKGFKIKKNLNLYCILGYLFMFGVNLFYFFLFLKILY